MLLLGSIRLGRDVTCPVRVLETKWIDMLASRITTEVIKALVTVLTADCAQATSRNSTARIPTSLRTQAMMRNSHVTRTVPRPDRKIPLNVRCGFQQ